MKKKKWVIFGAVLLFLAAAGLGIYFGTPAIPREKTEREVPVQSVAGLTGYAEEMADTWQETLDGLDLVFPEGE